jgi:hypothetical protein
MAKSEFQQKVYCMMVQIEDLRSEIEAIESDSRAEPPTYWWCKGREALEKQLGRSLEKDELDAFRLSRMEEGPYETLTPQEGQKLLKLLWPTGRLTSKSVLSMDLLLRRLEVIHRGNR